MAKRKSNVGASVGGALGGMVIGYIIKTVLSLTILLGGGYYVLKNIGGVDPANLIGGVKNAVGGTQDLASGAEDLKLGSITDLGTDEGIGKINSLVDKIVNVVGIESSTGSKEAQTPAEESIKQPKVNTKDKKLSELDYILKHGYKVDDVIVASRYLGMQTVYIITTNYGTEVKTASSVDIRYYDGECGTYLMDNPTNLFNVMEVNFGRTILLLNAQDYINLSNTYSKVSKSDIKGIKLE